MQSVSKNYRSLALLWEMHRDTLLMSLAIAVGLAIGGGAASAFLPAL